MQTKLCPRAGHVSLHACNKDQGAATITTRVVTTFLFFYCCPPFIFSNQSPDLHRGIHTPTHAVKLNLEKGAVRLCRKSFKGFGVLLSDRARDKHVGKS